ncbi:hypothetical protein HYPGJ_30248 [Hyphomicrobium sp. GJ21]|nr:hypothetical protein HYPGJ_30248 [Hyphomicrobium sp. GJ21]
MLDKTGGKSQNAQYIYIPLGLFGLQTNPTFPTL